MAATPTARNDVGGRSIYDIDASDPNSELIQRGEITRADAEQIGELMGALSALRDAEQELSEASRRYMKVNNSDMRALHYLIVCAHQDVTATPGGIAQHLGFSSAATTKLLDRLERDGHVTRARHPNDRRALSISITPTTYRAAMDTVGRQQARRFHAAARLSPDERALVTRFLRDMTEEISLPDGEWPSADTAATSAVPHEAAASGAAAGAAETAASPAADDTGGTTTGGGTTVTD